MPKYSNLFTQHTLDKTISYLESLLLHREEIEAIITDSRKHVITFSDGTTVNLCNGLCFNLELYVSLTSYQGSRTIMEKWPFKTIDSVAYFVPYNLFNREYNQSCDIFDSYKRLKNNMFGACDYGQARWALIEYLLGELKK